MTVERIDAVTGEVVELTEAEARRLRVSTAWADLATSITEAYQRRADAAAATGYSTAIPRIVRGIVSLDPPTIRCGGCGHEATGRTLAMVVQHSGIEFDPARYLADPRRLCRDCRIKAGWRVEP